MVKYELTSWFIGDSVPCRLDLYVNGEEEDSGVTPTITIYDSAGTKKVDAVNMAHEATGHYVYYAPTTEWVVGKCFWYANYQLTGVNRVEQAMFFIYDQPTWANIEEVRSALDELQEGELASSTIYEHYHKSTRLLTPKASGTVDAEDLHDAIIADAALKSYISYLTDRERAGDQLGIGTIATLQNLTQLRDEYLVNIGRGTQGTGERLKGVFATTGSAMQLTTNKGMDKANYKGTVRDRSS